MTASDNARKWIKQADDSLQDGLEWPSLRETRVVVIAMLDENEAQAKRLEAAERKETVFLGMVAEEIGFERTDKIWQRLLALAATQPEEGQ